MESSTVRNAVNDAAYYGPPPYDRRRNGEECYHDDNKMLMMGRTGEQQQRLRRRRDEDPSSWSDHDDDLQLRCGGRAAITRRGDEEHEEHPPSRKRQRRRERSWSRDRRCCSSTDLRRRADRRRRRRFHRRRSSFETSTSSASVTSSSPHQRRGGSGERYLDRWRQPQQRRQHELQHPQYRYDVHNERLGVAGVGAANDSRFESIRQYNNDNKNHHRLYSQRGERDQSWEESESQECQLDERHRRRRRSPPPLRPRPSPPFQQQYQQQQQQQQQRPYHRQFGEPAPRPMHQRHLAVAPVALQLPRAGVVSVDDDAPSPPHDQQRPPQQVPAVPSSKTSITAPLQQQQQQQQQNQNHHSKNKKRSNNHGDKRPSSDDDDESRDDAAGHFQGGPGDVVGRYYEIIKDLGIGTFGRVVECHDMRRVISKNNNNYHPSRQRGAFPSQAPDQHHAQHENRDRVAIKIVRNVKKKKYYESALIEAGIVEEVNRRGGRGMSHCAILWEAFSFDGHFCMVFESLGLSLYDFLKQHSYQPFPMFCIRDFAQQLLEALEFLHSFQLIHTDLKPENILLTGWREVNYRGYRVPESTRIKVIDFGGATYDYERKSSVINTRQYRSPEVILGVGWSMPSDLWSAGCILAELYSGELLFATHDNQEHLALMERIIGLFPRWMIKRAKNSQLAHQSFSSSSGRHRGPDVLSSESALYVQKMSPLDSMIRKQDDRFLQLLRRLLVIDPNERSTAKECLRYCM